MASLPSAKPWNKEEGKGGGGMMVFSFYRLVSKDARTDEGGLSFSSGSAYRLELGGTQPQTMYFMQSRPAFNDINC